MWNEFEGSLARLIRHCYELRETMYLDSIKTALSWRGTPSWDMASFFLSKESFAMFFERARFIEEALIEYHELETVFVECAESSDPRDIGSIRFGASQPNSECCAFIESTHDPSSIRTALSTKAATEMMLRQYLFARQVQFLKRLGRRSIVLQRGIIFIQAMASALGAREEKLRPFFREAWIYSACIGLANFAEDILRDIAKDQGPASREAIFISRCRGDLLCYARVELAAIGEALEMGHASRKTPTAGLRKRGSCAVSSPSSSPFRRLTAALSHRQKSNSVGHTRGARSFEEELFSMEVTSRAKVTADAIASGSQEEEKSVQPVEDSKEQQQQQQQQTGAEEAVLNGSDEDDAATMMTPGDIQSMGNLDDDDDDDEDDGANGDTKGESGDETKVDSVDDGSRGDGTEQSTADADVEPTADENTVEEDPQLKFMSWLVSPDLRAVLMSEASFDSAIADLATAAADAFRACGRHRQAAQLDLEVADMHMTHGRFESAAVFLKQALPIYRIEAWNFISLKILLRLRLCFKEMGEHERLASTCLKLLSMCHNQKTAQSLTELQDEFVEAASHLKLEASASVDGDLRYLVAARKVSDVQRMHSYSDGDGRENGLATTTTTTITSSRSTAPKKVISANDTVAFVVELVSRFTASLAVRAVQLQLKYATGNDDISVVNCVRVAQSMTGDAVPTTTEAVAVDGDDNIFVLQPGSNQIAWQAQLPCAGKYYLHTLTFKVGTLSVSYPILKAGTRGLRSLVDVADPREQLHSSICVCHAAVDSRRVLLTHALESSALALVPGEKQYVGISVTQQRDLMTAAELRIEACSPRESTTNGVEPSLAAGASPPTTTASSLTDVDMPSTISPGFAFPSPQDVHVVAQSASASSVVAWTPGTSLCLPAWTEREPFTVWVAVTPSERQTSTSESTVHSAPLAARDRIALTACVSYGKEQRYTQDDIFEIAVIDPFSIHVSVKTVADDEKSGLEKCHIVQLVLSSRIALPLQLRDAKLHVQSGFGAPDVVDVCGGLGVLPCTVSAIENSASLLYVVKATKESGVEKVTANGNFVNGIDGKEDLSALKLTYTTIVSDATTRPLGALGAEMANATRTFTYHFDASMRKRPFMVSLLQPSFAELGMPVRLEWHVKRMVDAETLVEWMKRKQAAAAGADGSGEEAEAASSVNIPFEITAPIEGVDWLLSGEIRGCVEIPAAVGSAVIVSCHALPTRAGDLPVPRLRLPKLEEWGFEISFENPLVLHVRPNRTSRTAMAAATGAMPVTL